MGQRLGLIVTDLGDDKSVDLSGKSLRQLKRYIAGDEPPFGVLRRLVEASGATLDWLTFDRASSQKDRELAIRGREAKIKALQRELDRVTNVADAEKLKELIHLNRKLQVLDEEWLRLVRGLPTPESQRPRQKRAVTVQPQERNETQSAALAEIVRLVGETVSRVHGEMGVRLPESALVAELSRSYSALHARMVDPADLGEARTLLPWLEAYLQKSLREAAAAPGTGKREAS